MRKVSGWDGCCIKAGWLVDSVARGGGGWLFCGGEWNVCATGHDCSLTVPVLLPALVGFSHAHFWGGRAGPSEPLQIQVCVCVCVCVAKRGSKGHKLISSIQMSENIGSNHRGCSWVGPDPKAPPPPHGPQNGCTEQCASSAPEILFWAPPGLSKVPA